MMQQTDVRFSHSQRILFEEPSPHAGYRQHDLSHARANVRTLSSSAPTFPPTPTPLVTAATKTLFQTKVSPRNLPLN